MVIYIDLLLVVNFIISYFLLLASSLLAGYTYKRKRIVIASVIGALFCLYIFADINSVTADIAVKILSLTICSFVAFGFENKRKLLLQTFCYLCLNMLITGGAILVSSVSKAIYHNNMFVYFKINPVILVLSSAAVYTAILIFEMIKEKITPGRLYTVDIICKDFAVKNVAAFYDSGFNVKDIVSNKDVILLSTESISSQLPQKVAEDIKDFIKGEYTGVKNHFIPVFFRTVSGEGMLPALKAEYILIENKRIENVLVAFTDSTLSENTAALFGTDIRRQV